MFGAARLYAYIGIAAAIAIALGGAYLKGRSDGSEIAAAKWRAEKIEIQQAEIARIEAMRNALAEREVALEQQRKRTAEAVARVHTEFLPGKTIVKREIVERVEYRECVVDERVRDILDAALRGDPAAAAKPLTDDSVAMSF